MSRLPWAPVIRVLARFLHVNPLCLFGLSDEATGLFEETVIWQHEHATHPVAIPYQDPQFFLIDSNASLPSRTPHLALISFLPRLVPVEGLLHHSPSKYHSTMTLLDELLGATLVGAVVATLLFGVVLAQLYSLFVSEYQTTRMIKLLAALVG
jgi:hypothetical protein